MTSYVIGVDPGSTKGHGVAVYQDGQLKDLLMLELMPLYELLKNIKGLGSVIVHIENVHGQRGVWHGYSQNKKAFGKTSENVGLCKWAQIEVERMCAHIGVDIVRHGVSSAWKDNNGKAQFEKVTGWNGQSNEDKRSAAYFGYIGLK